MIKYLHVIPRLQLLNHRIKSFTNSNLIIHDRIHLIFGTYRTQIKIETNSINVDQANVGVVRRLSQNFGQRAEDAPWLDYLYRVDPHYDVYIHK